MDFDLISGWMVVFDVEILSIIMLNLNKLWLVPQLALTLAHA